MNRKLRPSMRYLLAAAAGAALLASGCGRTLPDIDAGTLASKKSVLVLAAPSLTDEEEQEIRSAAALVARENKLALEWVPDAGELTPDLAAKFRNPSVDSIIAVGNELLPQAAEEAENQTGKRIVLLGSGLDRSASAGGLPEHLMVRSLDEGRKNAVWNDWVQLQKANGLNVLWITRTTSGIPSEWVPSEEADRILQRDIYPGDSWFPQLSFQAQSLPAHMIALYTPLEEAELAKVKSLKLPIVDIGAGIGYRYRWDTVIRNAISSVLEQSWTGGEKPYTDQEVTLSRK